MVRMGESTKDDNDLWRQQLKATRKLKHRVDEANKETRSRLQQTVDQCEAAKKRNYARKVAKGEIKVPTEES